MQRCADHSHDVALHEARHASYASHRGLEVLGVRVGALEGHTDVRLPMEPSQLQQAWEADPTMAMYNIHSIVGALVAPVAAEGKLFRGPTDDSTMLERYGRAWAHLRPSRATGERAPAWLALLAAVRSEVRTWATAPGALLATYELAHWLLNEGTVDATGWAWLWAQPFARPLHQPRTAPPSIRIADAAQCPQPIGAARPKITGLDIQVAWYEEDLERLQRSMTHGHQNPRFPLQTIRYAA